MNHLPSLDDDGHLKNHNDWTPKIAQRLADTIGVTLESEHYQIIGEVRVFFETYHHSPSTRPLIKYLMASLHNLNISKQKLQKLFNTGLVARHVIRIAGLPKPPNCL